MTNRIKSVFFAFLVTLLAAGGVFAQEVRPGPKGSPREDNGLVFLSARGAFSGKVVTGAPYSAEAVTETTQTLADGNRIVRKNTFTVYRDSQGRTRSDQSLATVGPWAVAGEPARMVFIHDPVSSVDYILDPNTRVARKMSGERRPFGPNPGFRFQERPSGVGRTHEAGSNAPAVGTGSGPRKESLGRKFIEGVDVEGERMTRTIAANQVGNENPIQIVSERWYAPELEIEVLTSYNDPRFGETVYRLTNLRRGEPDASLFQVPSDYTVKDQAVEGRSMGPRPDLRKGPRGNSAKEPHRKP